MTEPNEQQGYGLIRRALLMICAVLFVGTLYIGRELFIPFVLAAFFCFLLSPAVRLVERLRVGRVVAVFSTVLCGLGIVLGFGWLVGSQAAGLVTQFPQYRDNVISKFQGVQASVSSIFNSTSGAMDRLVQDISKPTSQTASAPAVEPAVASQNHTSSSKDLPGTSQKEPAASADENGEPVQVQVVAPKYHLLSLIGTILGPVFHPLTTAGATTILVFFLLIYREDLRDRVVVLCGHANIQVTTLALEDCARRVTRYLAAQAMANSAIGIVTGIGLYFLGIPNAALWGLIAAVFRFIPYIGSFMAAIFPVSLAVALFDGWRTPLMALAWCILADMMSAYLLEPWFFGAKTGVSPTAILFSFLFWGWLWGGIGLLLATPITVCLVVLGKHIPAFEGFSILLGDQPVMEPKARLYQRILALNLDDAIKIFQASVEKTSFVEACDQVLLPTLAQLENDRQTGLLDDQRVEFAKKTVTSIVEKFGTPPPPAPDANATEANKEVKEVKSVVGPKALVFVAGDRGAFDDLIPLVIAKALANDPIIVKPVASASTVAEILTHMRDEEPVGFVFAAIEPRDSSRMRHICKRLEEWAGPIHIALFSTSRGMLGYRRFSRESSQHLHETLGELLNELRRTASSHLINRTDTGGRTDGPSILGENRALRTPVLEV